MDSLTLSLQPRKIVYVAVVDEVEVAEGKTAEEAMAKALAKGYARSQIRLRTKLK